MKSSSLSLFAGSVVTLASIACGADAPVAPAAGQPAGAKPAAAKPAAVAPAATVEPSGMPNEIREKQMKISAEMREISMKLKPAYEKLQSDPDLKAAIDNMMKAQAAVNELREKKLRADPETAKLVDRMEALRNEMKEISSQLMGAGMPGRPGPGGAPRAMPAPKDDSKPVAPAVAPKAP